MTPIDPQPVTTDEIERVRNAMITHGDLRTACSAAGILPDRVPQFERIFRDIRARNTRAQKWRGRR